MAETKISTKHIAAVEAYLANGYRRIEAVIAAGYKESRAKQTASDIFNRPEVKDYLAERMKALQMTADEAMLRLAGHASGDMRQFMGLSMDDLKNHPNGWLIKELTYDVIMPKKGKKKPTSAAGEVAEEITEPFVYIDHIKLYDSQAALVTILKQSQLASGQPTENVNIPQLAELSSLLTAMGKDLPSVIARMVEKLKAEAQQS